jgi:5'-3' exonuclease
MGIKGLIPLLDFCITDGVDIHELMGAWGNKVSICGSEMIHRILQKKSAVDWIYGRHSDAWEEEFWQRVKRLHGAGFDVLVVFEEVSPPLKSLVGDSRAKERDKNLEDALKKARNNVNFTLMTRDEQGKFLKLCGKCFERVAEMAKNIMHRIDKYDHGGMSYMVAPSETDAQVVHLFETEGRWPIVNDSDLAIFGVDGLKAALKFELHGNKKWSCSKLDLDLTKAPAGSKLNGATLSDLKLASAFLGDYLRGDWRVKGS